MAALPLKRFSISVALPLALPLSPSLYLSTWDFLGCSLCLDLLLLLLLNCNQLKINQLKCSEKQFIIEKQPKHRQVETADRQAGRQAGREGLGAAVVAQMKLWQQSQLTRVAPAAAAAAAECRVLSADRTVSAECGLHQVALLTHTCRKEREEE